MLIFDIARVVEKGSRNQLVSDLTEMFELQISLFSAFLKVEK